MRKINHWFHALCLFLFTCYASLHATAAEEYMYRISDEFIKDTILKDSTSLRNDITIEEEQLQTLIVNPINNTDTNKFAITDTFLSEINEHPDEFANEEDWENIASYFSVWDENKVNPYQINPCAFKDTLEFILFDTAAALSIFQDSSTPDSTRLRRRAFAPTGPTSKSSGFGFRGIRFHSGVDLRLKKGDSVYAVFDGIVRMVSKDRKGYGNFVVIRHFNGLETLYGHLNFSVLNVGQEVRAGDLLGYGGNTGRSTGPHLHFEARFQGNAIDPELLFDFSANTFKSDRFTLIPRHFAYALEKKKRVYHTIKKGNTLSGISRKYRVPVYTLCRFNGISPKKLLRIGKKIRVR